MTANPADIKITIDPDGSPTEILLMLVKPEDKPKEYLITEVPVPEQHLDWVQKDFRGGMFGQRPQPSGTDRYWVALNFLADPQTGHLWSGPDFKTATTVGSADLSVFGGCVHRLADGTHIGFLINNNDLFKSNTAGTTFASTKDPGAVIPLSVASWGDYVLMAIQGTNGYWYTPDEGANWVQSTLDPGKYQDYFIPAGDVLWGVDAPDTLRWTTDPTNATGEWSGETLVGQGTNDLFVGGFFMAQMLIIVKTSGIYIVDDGANVEQIVTVKNIRGACTDGVSKIFFIDIQDNVWEYDIFQGLLRNLNFHSSVYRNPDIGGNVGGGIEWADGKVFVSPSKQIMQWSQFRDNRGQLQGEAWENLYTDTSLAATQGMMFAANELLDGTRVDFPVYFGGGDASSKMGYVRARTLGDFGDTGSLTYSTVASSVISCIIDHEHPTTRKMYQYAEVDLGGVGVTAKVSYSIDYGAFATFQTGGVPGAGDVTLGTGKTLLEFPAGTEGYMMVFQLINTPADNTKYCEIKSWSVHATLQPSYRRMVKMAVRIADGLTLRGGARHSQRGDTIRTNLEAARTTAARLQLQDYFGNNFDIVMLSPLVEVPSRDEKASDTESEIQFVAVEYGVRVAT